MTRFVLELQDQFKLFPYITLQTSISSVYTVLILSRSRSQGFAIAYTDQIAVRIIVAAVVKS